MAMTTRIDRHDANVRADRAQSAQGVAVALIGAVRDLDSPRIATLLDRADLPALAVVLAAMVPDDERLSDLLGWTAALPAPQPLGVQPHGTHAAFVRHWARSEPPCELCVHGERAYQRDRKRRARSTDPTRHRVTS